MSGARPGSISAPRSGGTGRRAPAALAACLLGVLHTLSFAPFGWWPLQIAAPAALLVLALNRQPMAAAGLGWLFGLGWFGAGWWWLFISLNRYGGLPAPLAAAAVGLLAAAMAVYPALALGLWARLKRPGGGWQPVVLWVGCWLASELARGCWFSGFPWSAGGYAHTEGPLAAWAPWVGVYGIGALSAGLSAALALLAAAMASRGAVRGAAVLAAAWAGAIGLGSLALPQGFTRGTGTLAVSLVQTAIPQDLKFDLRRFEANLAGLQASVAAARGALVVTPESVVPLPFEQVDQLHWQAMLGAVSQPGRGALIGVFLPVRGEDGQTRYVNSMIGLKAGQLIATGQFYRYGKRHLLPFGEVIPPGFRWFVEAMRIPMDDQASGTSEAPFELAGQRLRPLICFEDLFGEDFVASAVGPEAATVFVNASNLAWFGRWMVLDQHLQFSQMRALEFQRPFVRATNTGATAALDHRGQVIARLPPETAGTLDTQVEGRIGDTPYARWLHALGLWPLWGLALALLATGFAGAAPRPGLGGTGR